MTYLKSVKFLEMHVKFKSNLADSQILKFILQSIKLNHGSTHHSF